MNPESSTTELLLHNDERLLAAIQAVIEHASEQAGLSEAAREDLATATADACGEAFAIAGRNGSADPVVKLAISGFADRVEIAVEHRGDCSTRKTLRNIDRVDCDTREGMSRTTLVKYAATSKSEHHS